MILFCFCHCPSILLQDKEELLAILPEMGGPKCVNGVSWLLYQNPMILLDDTTYFFETKWVDNLTIELITYDPYNFHLDGRTHFMF